MTITDAARHNYGGEYGKELLKGSRDGPQYRIPMT
jgi:hypothetical protein